MQNVVVEDALHRHIVDAQRGVVRERIGSLVGTGEVIATAMQREPDTPVAENTQAKEQAEKWAKRPESAREGPYNHPRGTHILTNSQLHSLIRGMCVGHRS